MPISLHFPLRSCILPYFSLPSKSDNLIPNSCYCPWTSFSWSVMQGMLSHLQNVHIPNLLYCISTPLSSLWQVLLHTNLLALILIAFYLLESFFFLTFSHLIQEVFVLPCKPVSTGIPQFHP